MDDIFVLVRSVEEVDEQHPCLPLPERFRKALNLGGMSITVTSVTNATAFMFGSMTAIPSVRWCATVENSFRFFKSDVHCSGDGWLIHETYLIITS